MGTKSKVVGTKSENVGTNLTAEIKIRISEGEKERLAKSCKCDGRGISEAIREAIDIMLSGGKEVHSGSGEIDKLIADIGCSEGELAEALRDESIEIVNDGGVIIMPTEDTAAMVIGVDHVSGKEYYDALCEYTERCKAEKVDAVEVIKAVTGEIMKGEWHRPCGAYDVSDSTLRDLEQMAILSGGSLQSLLDGIREQLNSGEIGIEAGATKVLVREQDERDWGC